MNIVDWLKGKKTYVVSLVSAVVGVYQLIHTSQFNFTNVTALLGAGGLASLRAAVAKVEAALLNKTP